MTTTNEQVQAAARFRKKPVVVEAVQWFPGVPHDGVVVDRGGYYVTTIHGQKAWLAPGDWILPEPMPGHFYPCKPDIFAATYEPEESATRPTPSGLDPATVEAAAKCVPTNWCDSLLTGPNASNVPLDCRAIEKLLRGIQDRIRALAAKEASR